MAAKQLISGLEFQRSGGANLNRHRCDAVACALRKCPLAKMSFTRAGNTGSHIQSS
jgi:hypothetical protein